ncbi:MAG: PEGA domain-containing protein [Deltaproteobacteria bacterium]|nr:PEGA domain-containing protein [Deltaproteobacteria bacterium]
MRIFLLVASASFLLSCGKETPSAAAVATKSTQVVVASKPEGASVLLQGAKVGVTPVTLQVKEDTNLVLELDGFVRQALLVTPDGRPNHVVQLIPAPALQCCPCQGDANEGKAEPRKSASAAALEPPRPKAAGGGGIRTMREAKEAYRAGRVDRYEYGRVTDGIREKLRAEIDELKRAYRAGEMSKADYERKARAVKLKYEG